MVMTEPSMIFLPTERRFLGFSKGFGANGSFIFLQKKKGEGLKLGDTAGIRSAKIRVLLTAKPVFGLKYYSFLKIKIAVGSPALDFSKLQKHRVCSLFLIM